MLLSSSANLAIHHALHHAIHHSGSSHYRGNGRPSLPTPAELVRGVANTGASTSTEISHPALVAQGLGTFVEDGLNYVKGHPGKVLFDGGLTGISLLGSGADLVICPNKN